MALFKDAQGTGNRFHRVYPLLSVKVHKRISSIFGLIADVYIFISREAGDDPQEKQLEVEDA